MPDRQLILDIIDCADRWHASATWLLATSLVENGALYDCSPTHEADGSTSYGPFQLNTNGALIGHPPSWACTKDAVCTRARAFAMAGVRDGAGAARVQRPADKVGYARKVNDVSASADRYIRAARQGRLPKGDSSGHIDTAGEKSLTDSIPGVGQVKSLAEAFAWIFDRNNAMRVVKLIGGVALLLIGVFLVAKSQGVDLPVPVPV